MKTPKINEDIRDNYIDATVAVFMDQYAAALDEGILEEMDACADNEFPTELDARCLSLIEKEAAKQRRARHTKSILRMCRSAAVIALVLLGACSVLFMTVEAFRLPVLNFFIEKTDLYWEFTGHNPEDNISIAFNEADPLGGFLPDGFELLQLHGSFDGAQYYALYKDSEARQMCFFANASDGFTQMDTENAEVTEFLLSEHEAIISIENGAVRLMWFDINRQKMFSLWSDEFSEDFVITLGEEIAKLLR